MNKNRILWLKRAAWETCKETALILSASVVVLTGCALVLYFYRPSSAAYAITGLFFILLFSLFISFGWFYGKPLSQVRPVIARCLSLICISSTFFVLVPVTIERSVSVFLLQNMNAKPLKSYDDTDLESLLISEYLCKGSAIEKRMTEQKYIGNIEQLQNNQYHLTVQGIIVADELAFMGDFFSVPHRLAHREETQHTCSNP